MAETVLVAYGSDGVAIVTLNRPEAMNALSKAMRADLHRVMIAIRNNASIRSVVLTGAGTRAFTAGLDLKELGSDPGAMSAANAVAGEDNPARAIADCGKPVVGAINGVAITGGFELALACDLMIASENARFADTHAGVGILPGWGLSQNLSRRIGIGRAKEMSLTGNFLDAATAERWGLVNHVVAVDELLPRAIRLAADIASADAEMVGSYRSLIDEGYALGLGAALAYEHHVSSIRNGTVTPEQVEARRAGVLGRGRAQ